MNEQDLLTIKEFSEFTGIKQSVLRHYDEIGLFRPIHRGANGYRYYSAPQTIAVNLIHIMKNVGVNLRKIAEIEKVRTPKSILKLLQRQETQMTQDLLRLQKAMSIIQAYSNMIFLGLMADENAISIEQMDELPIVLGPENDFSTGFFYSSFFNFVKYMEEQKVELLSVVGGYYKDFNTFADAPGQPTNFFIHSASGKDSKKASDYLVGYARGYYGKLGDLPERLKNYAEENNITIEGPVYEMYLHDEISVTDPEQYLIRVSISVKK